MDRRFTAAVLLVSALAALAVALLDRGIGAGEVALEASGALIAVVAGLGLIVLARVVVITERDRRRR